MKEGARAILSSGGKRIRPGLALLSARLFSEPVGHPAITCAAAIEMIHTASLLHDDVIDNAVTRRGRAATHVAWNNKASVLLGDFLLARALRELTKSDSIDLFREVAEATSDMTCGQILELRHEANFAITLDEYISVVRNKTAALFSLACRCAALLHEASPAQSSALSGFGEKLGIAYQITDDCLDYWGSEEKLGKPVGTDLAEKKLTLPFIYMYGEARENERARIREIVQRERIPPADFDIILSHMETYGARKAALALADEYFAGAEDHLSVLPDSEARAALGDLVHYLRDRER
jgi:octaprenyl-diphosphate synthase